MVYSYILHVLIILNLFIVCPQCHLNAECYNSVTCTCREGFYGNGHFCAGMLQINVATVIEQYF